MPAGFLIILAFLVFGESREINFSFYVGIALILLSVLLQTRRALGGNKYKNVSHEI